MTVLRSKRNISKFEYENTFTDLYQFSTDRTSKIPKRRSKWLCTEIDEKMNSLFLGLMQINETYFKNEKLRKEYAGVVIPAYISLLNSLDKPLLVLWNVEKTKTKTMIQWIEKIRKEINVLNKMIDEDIQCNIILLDWKTINNAKFLKNMSKLHRYTHSKVINAPKKYDSTEGSLLIELVNNAFYELIMANQKIPETYNEYMTRREHISKAMTYLNEMNRPMLFYFNLMQYSEKVMIEWSELLTSEIKMLAGLQKSDRERFSKLK